MITKAKLAVYRSYEGDIDRWGRMRGKAEQSLMTDNEWMTIDRLLQDLHIVKNGRAAQSFTDATELKLAEVCDSEETIAAMKTYDLEFR